MSKRSFAARPRDPETWVKAADKPHGRKPDPAAIGGLRARYDTDQLSALRR